HGARGRPARAGPGQAGHPAQDVQRQGPAPPRPRGLPQGQAGALGGPDMSDEQIEDWLVARIAAELGLIEDDIDRAEVFASFGLDSLKAVALAGELEILLGRRLPPTLLWDYPT